MTTFAPSDVEAAATALANAVPLAASELSVGKIYEGWLLLQLGIALRDAGWKVEWRDWQDSPSATKVFRGGPAPITASSDPGPAPGFLFIEEDGREFEVHNSVQFRGGSGALHEIDVAIIPRETGEDLRKTGGHPDEAPRAALELKCYTSSMPIGVVRAMALAAIDVALFGVRNRHMTGSGIVCTMYKPAHKSLWIGEIDKGYVGAVTSAPQVGRSGTLARHYGAKVTSSFNRDAVSSGAMQQLADDIKKYLV